MITKKTTLTFFAIILALYSCHKPTETMTVINTDIITKEVKNQVQAFHAADTSLNAAAVVDLLWPEFTMLADGNYVNYEQVKSGSLAYMASLESFDTQWDELKIILLGSDHAISAFIFNDSIVSKDRTVTQSRGPNTFVWEKRDNQWKVIYADADHYPVE